MSFFEEKKENDHGHPDSLIRLASAVHRFRVPQIDPEEKPSFAKSFKTTGSSEKTRKAILKADEFRATLGAGLRAKKVSHERVAGDAKRYTPLVNQILVSCKVQPEMARLDERLVFFWASGLEKEAKVYKSEAIMYDLVMAIACHGLGRAGTATECSISGDFAAASRDYATAAGVFSFLANEQIPQWIAKGSNVDEDSLPLECSEGATSAIEQLFTANGQQMAVATLLIKPGTPNYSLVAKLCLGVHEQLDNFIQKMRKEAFSLMQRMDKDFLTLMAFQIALYKSLTLYFQARSQWESRNYGIAIGLLSEASVALRIRDTAASNGIPDISKCKNLKALYKDLNHLKKHMQSLLGVWEADNSRVYFESVPRVVPKEHKLQEGVKLSKKEKFELEDVEPLLLSHP